MKIIIVDTEFTAWEGSASRNWSKPSEHREIIQIAAIKFDIENVQIVGKPFQCFVYPKINPTLSKYIRELTKISQETINTNGLYFQDAFENFLKFKKDNYTVSWGNEHTVFNENCKVNLMDNTYLQEEYFNMNKYLNNKFHNSFQTTSGKLKTLLDLQDDIVGQEHNALHDVYSIALCIQYLISTKKIQKKDLIYSITQKDYHGTT